MAKSKKATKVAKKAKRTYGWPSEYLRYFEEGISDKLIAKKTGKSLPTVIAKRRALNNATATVNLGEEQPRREAPAIRSEPAPSGTAKAIEKQLANKKKPTRVVHLEMHADMDKMFGSHITVFKNGTGILVDPKSVDYVQWGGFTMRSFKDDKVHTIVEKMD